MHPLASLCGSGLLPKQPAFGTTCTYPYWRRPRSPDTTYRHVSSRTKDTAFENVVFELEDARDELAARPWLKPALFAPPAQRVPLQLRQAQRVLHFLGLLKLRVAPELPLELWQEVVRHVFSCETAAAQVVCVGSRLELAPFPSLPPDAELELLAAALQKRTGSSDVALLDGFCRRPARHAAALADAAAPDAPDAPDAAAPGSLHAVSVGGAPSEPDGSVRSALSLGDHMRVRLSLTLAGS